jgi:hypothetical protein
MSAAAALRGGGAPSATGSPAGEAWVDRTRVVVDVIVPVHRDVEATRRCLDSLLAAPVKCAHEIVVVNDGSPEP